MNEDATNTSGSGRMMDAGGLFAGYPGAALLVRGDGTVLSTNAKGAGIEALLQHDAAPEILHLIEKAGAEGAVTVGSVSTQGSRGEVPLEITVVPRDGDETLLVLARDLTMERNLCSALVESRQRYKDLVEVSSDFSWEVGPGGTFVFVSPKGALGYSAADLVERRPAMFVRDAEESDKLPFLSERPQENIEMWMVRADGEPACVLVSSEPLLAEDGEWRGARGICRDVTPQRRQEAALAQARNREQLRNHIVSTIRDEVEPLNMLTAAAAATGHALGAVGCRIYRLDDARKFNVAAQYGTSLGLEGVEAELTGLKSDSGVAIAEAGDGGALVTATHYRQKVNGAIAICRDQAAGEWNDDAQILLGDVANQLGIANEQITNHEHVVNMSRTDAMTGMLNRCAFLEQALPRRIARLEYSRGAAALFYVDIDNFKRVNDAHGHQAGDNVILFLRDMLLKHSRQGDELARFGGDEFAMWLDDIPYDVMVRRAEELMEDSKRMLEFSGDADHPLGISVGVAIYDPATGENLDDLFARADEAMYAVKHAGKSGYRIASEPRLETKDTERPS